MPASVRSRKPLTVGETVHRRKLRDARAGPATPAGPGARARHLSARNRARRTCARFLRGERTPEGRETMPSSPRRSALRRRDCCWKTALSGFQSTAMRAARGTTCCMSSTCLPTASCRWTAVPVTLEPGERNYSTMPAATGSLTATITTGSLPSLPSAAIDACVTMEAMTSGFYVTEPAASDGSFS